MAITEKYEHLATDGRETTDCSRAKHRRLDRVTQIHRVSKPDTPAAQQAVRDVASKLATLDHPLIPHVIDFLEDETHYHLVVEAVKTSNSPQATQPHKTPEQTASPIPHGTQDILDELHVLEQTADALHHAAERGIAHGDFSQPNIGVDGQGIIESHDVHKINGLGIRQLKMPTSSFEELTADDLANLKSIVRKTLHSTSLASPGIDASVDEEASSNGTAQTEALQALLQRASREQDNIASFSRDFRAWLNRELALREAKKLAFADPADEEREQGNSGRGSFMLLSACAIAAVLLIGLLGFVLWTTFTSDTAEQLAKNSIAESNTAAPKETPRPAVTSDLENVGTLNNLDSTDPTTPPTVPDTSKPITDDNMAPSVAESPKSPSVDDIENEIGEETPPESATNEAEPGEPETDKPNVPKPRTKSPFEAAPSSTDLPLIDEGTTLALLSTDLRAEEPLTLSLYSDAAKQAKFEIRQNGDQQSNDEPSWSIHMQRRSEAANVGTVTRSDGEIRFQWTTDAAKASAANQLRNSIIEFRSGRWSHDLALRKPSQRPMVSFNLERARPYTIDIDHAPADLFLEFVPSDDSLAVASPQQIAWKDATMMIGLDAGKESLVMLQLKPQSRNKLKATGFARQTTGARRMPMKAGFARQLRASMMAMNSNLFGMKTGVKNITGKDAGKKKEHVQKMIKALEEKKRLAEVFQEAYAAATRTKVRLRVYCQPGGRKLVLADYSGQSDNQPNDN